MRIERIENNVTFRSGYPTFGTGHLSVKINNRDNVYKGYKPIEGTGTLFRLDYLA